MGYTNIRIQGEKYVLMIPQIYFLLVASPLPYKNSFNPHQDIIKTPLNYSTNMDFLDL